MLRKVPSTLVYAQFFSTSMFLSQALMTSWLKFNINLFPLIAVWNRFPGFLTLPQFMKNLFELFALINTHSLGKFIWSYKSGFNKVVIKFRCFVRIKIGKVSFRGIRKILYSFLYESKKVVLWSLDKFRIVTAIKIISIITGFSIRIRITFL